MTEYTDAEVRIEQEMADRGSERRRAQASRLREVGRESLTGPGHRLVRAAMGRVVSALEAWIREQSRLPVPNLTLPAARQVSARVAALIALRAVLDEACRRGSWQAVVHAVGRRLEEERAAGWLAREHPGTWQAMGRSARAVPGRASSRLRREVRRAMRAPREGDGPGFARWTMTERLRVGALMVHLVAEHAGLVAVRTVRLGRRRRRVVVELLPETEAWIAGASSAEEALEPLYMPMLDAPGDWGPGLEGGYATGLVRRRHLVKNRSRATRELVAGAEMPAVYAAVNALQRTAWEVNPDVLQVAQELFRLGLPCPGLDGAEDDPLPERPGQVSADWMRRRFLVRRGNLQRRGRRAEAARILWLAGRMSPEGRFHFPQQLDFRGRTYPVPQFLQPQGPDLARGMLRFAEGDWTQGNDWFWIHGANCLGLDKLSLGDRIKGIRDRARDIMAVHRDPIDCRWWQEADEPWQFLAWCLEAGELLDQGQTLTRVPCYADGTNNGLQILSLLLRDPVGGAATNCVPGPRRDVYQDVADEVTRRLREEDDDLARGWLAWFEGGRVPRAAAKRTVMTLPYGCTRWSSRQYVADWFEEEVRLGRPNPWGPKAHEAWTRLAGHLWDAVAALLGRAMEAMAWMREAARTSLEAGVTPRWVAPSGFPVRQAYTNWQVQQVRTRFGERVRWVRSRKAGDRPNLRRHVNALAPNFVHSLDAAVLALTVSHFAREIGGPVSTIHDSFGTTAPRMDQLVLLIRETYDDVFSSDLLENLREQLAANAGGIIDFPVPPERGMLDPHAVITSQYLFS